MKFESVAKRITGISCPIFGISWNPPEAECEVAQRVVTFLEDRRVLYDPFEDEVPDHCIDSVIRIREKLTSELESLSSQSELAGPLRAIRASCRKFLGVSGRGGGEVFRSGMGYFQFSSALGQFRGIVGLHIARIATAYGLGVEDQLAEILPAAEPEEKVPRRRSAPARSPQTKARRTPSAESKKKKKKKKTP